MSVPDVQSKRLGPPLVESRSVKTSAKLSNGTAHHHVALGQVRNRSLSAPPAHVKGSTYLGP